MDSKDMDSTFDSFAEARDQPKPEFGFKESPADEEGSGNSGLMVLNVVFICFFCPTALSPCFALAKLKQYEIALLYQNFLDCWCDFDLSQKCE